MQGMAPTLGRGGLPHSVPRPPALGSELTSEVCPRNGQASGSGSTCPGWRRCTASAEHRPLWVCSRAMVLVGSSGFAPSLGDAELRREAELQFPAPPPRTPAPSQPQEPGGTLPPTGSWSLSHELPLMETKEPQALPSRPCSQYWLRICTSREYVVP